MRLIDTAGDGKLRLISVSDILKQPIQSVTTEPNHHMIVLIKSTQSNLNLLQIIRTFYPNWP